MNVPLQWSYRTAEIPDAGFREIRTATSAERATVAALLEVVSCEALTADFTIRATGQGCYRLAGKLEAELTQSCVVTLDPVAQRVEAAFDVEFWPPASVPRPGEAEVEALSAAEIDQLSTG